MQQSGTMQQEIFMQARDWIRAKDPKKLAVVLVEDYGTIRSWSSRNAIPRNKWPDILKAYPELGLNDLLAMEQVAKG